MKILQICPWLSDPPLSTASGVSVAAYRISRELATRGHDVTLCAGAIDPAGKSKGISQTFEGVKIITFSHIFYYYSFLVTLGIIPYLRKNLTDFDIVHIHDLRHFQALIAHHYAVHYSIPYVLQAHGAALPFRRKKLNVFFDVTLGRRLIRDADVMLALTDQEVNQYKSIGAAEHKIKILPNGIDLSEFIGLPSRGEFRRKHRLEKNEKVILFLGRIHEIKGLDLLIDAFGLLRKDLEDVRLVIAGPALEERDKRLERTLRQRTHDLGFGDRVLFVGPLYQRDKLEAYVDADVYVLPSRYETFPFTVLEAWACGTPVIVTDRCRISEYVRKAGRVVEFDKIALYKTLLSVLEDEVWRAQASKLGYELVRGELSWDRIIDQLEAFYYELSKNEQKRARPINYASPL